LRFQKLIKIFIIVIAIFLSNAYGPKETFSQWYMGGTLHQATGKEWHAATHANKLATCADFIAAWSQNDLLKDQYKPRNNPQRWKPLAEELVTAIDAYYEKKSNLPSTVASVSALVAMIGGWLK